MTFNTGNPIGSTDARDRSDNSENLDLAVNSLSQTFVDRFGVTRDTLEGIYQKSAYYRAGTFDAGYTLTNNRQTLAYGNVEYSWSGAFPKLVVAGATPATSGGIGAGAWVDRTDLMLRSELAQPNNLVGYQSSGVSALPRTVTNRLNDLEVSLADYCQIMDGVVDNTAGLLAACVSLGASGGTVKIPVGAKVLINSDITIPHNICIKGPYRFVGSPANNASAPYGLLTALIISSLVTVTFSGGSGISGILAYRKGMTFPAADASLFDGRAFQAGGDDVFIEKSMILGFAMGFYSNGFQRPRIEYLYHDNINGIEITQCADIAYLFQCHAWPFATIAAGGGLSSLSREGTAYYFHDLCDWGKITNCFSYGYLRSIIVSNANSVTISNCGSDNLYSAGPQHANSIAVEILGSSAGTRIINHQGAAQATASIRINTDAGLMTTIEGGDYWGGSTHGVLVSSGDVGITSNTFIDLSYGVSVTNPASRVFIDENRWQQIVSNPVLSTVSTSNVFIGANNDFGDFGGTVAGTNVTAPIIASAAVVPIPLSGDTFFISGTTNIGTLGGGYKGRKITLVFNSALTMLHSTGLATAMRLSGATNFSVSAGGTLSLVHTGTQWHEIGRSA